MQMKYMLAQMAIQSRALLRHFWAGRRRSVLPDLWAAMGQSLPPDQQVLAAGRRSGTEPPERTGSRGLTLPPPAARNEAYFVGGGATGRR